MAKSRRKPTKDFKQHSLAFKLKVLKEVYSHLEKGELKNTVITEIADKYNITPTIIYIWNNKYKKEDETAFIELSGKARIKPSLKRRHKLQILFNDEEYQKLKDIHFKNNPNLKSASKVLRNFLLKEQNNDKRRKK